MKDTKKRSLESLAPLDEANGESTFEPMNHPGHLVRRLHQICVAVFLDAAKDYNLTHVQFAALMAVQRFTGIDQTRMGKLIALDRQTTSNVLTRLADKGLVERRRKDKRTNALYLTGGGRALIDAMQSRIQGIDDVILQPLSHSERHTFMTLLKKLVGDNNELSRAPLVPIEQLTENGGMPLADHGKQSDKQGANKIARSAAKKTARVSTRAEKDTKS